jgi:hypothetical protein
MNKSKSKRHHKRQTQRKKKKGGIPPPYKVSFIQPLIDNTEIISFFIKLLNEPSFIENVIMKYQSFINSLTPINIESKMNYIDRKNRDCIHFIKGTIHWILFQNNEKIFEKLMNILIQCYKHTDFTQNSFPIFMDEFNKEIIELQNRNENTTFLEIIYKLCKTTPNIDTLFSENINSNTETNTRTSCLLQGLKTNSNNGNVSYKIVNFGFNYAMYGEIGVFGYVFGLANFFHCAAH